MPSTSAREGTEAREKREERGKAEQVGSSVAWRCGSSSATAAEAQSASGGARLWVEEKGRAEETREQQSSRESREGWEKKKWAAAVSFREMCTGSCYCISDDSLINYFTDARAISSCSGGGRGDVLEAQILSLLQRRLTTTLYSPRCWMTTTLICTPPSSTSVWCINIPWRLSTGRRT
jgi:hypothetical protein